MFAFFVVMDSLWYFKDYNELMILNNYINYDIKNNNLLSFHNDKFQVTIYNNREYEIMMKRTSLLSVEKYKKIKYIGIVE